MRPWGLGGVLGAAAVALALTASLTPSNPATVPSGVAVGAAESTALYCAGFTGARGGVPGEVSLTNVTSDSRTVALTIDSTAQATTTRSVTIAPYATVVVDGERSDHGYESMSVVVPGGGVSGVVRGAGTADRALRTTCATVGQRQWAAAGLSTAVGTTTTLSLLNPTATTSVVNVTALGAAGYLAPAPFQGVVVPAHGLVALDLNTAVVNSAAVAVRATAVRGQIVPVATESWSTGSVGATDVTGVGATTTAVFPAVPTAGGDESTVELANFSLEPVTVRLTVSLAPFAIPPFVVTVAPTSVLPVAISPASRVPAEGVATVVVTSSSRVVATLLTQVAHTTVRGLINPGGTATAQLLSADGDAGFAAVRVWNPSGGSASVTVSSWAPGATPTAVTVTVARDATVTVSVPRGNTEVLVSSSRDVAATGVIGRAALLNGLSGGQ